LLSILGTIVISVAGAAWWLKSQLTSAELAGLKSENAAHVAWRQFAETQAKAATERLNVATEKLATAGFTIEHLNGQIASGVERNGLTRCRNGPCTERVLRWLSPDR
jgi:hypothetical protein